MKDAVALNQWEEKARAKLVELCEAMLSGQLSYLEGAVKVCQLQHQIRVPDFDPDIMAFIAIRSETDHLPLEQVRHHWSAETLQKLAPEFERTEQWAAPFASEACRHLVQRFGAQQGIQARAPSPHRLT